MDVIALLGALGVGERRQRGQWVTHLLGHRPAGITAQPVYSQTVQEQKGYFPVIRLQFKRQHQAPFLFTHLMYRIGILFPLCQLTWMGSQGMR